MARRIDEEKARGLLTNALVDAEKLFADGKEPAISQDLVPYFDAVFSSATQAYREVHLGCVLVRVLDKGADIRLPYASQGDTAFNGRTLDEQVVNPFLRENQIPCSTGPYLNVFRRQVKFDEATREGVRDKSGYDAFLAILSLVERTRDDKKLRGILTYTLHRFVLLREQSNVPLSRIHRISLRQYETLLNALLDTPSGGRLPLLIVDTMLRAIRDTFSLDWTIECQGINVSDRSSGAGGDITVARDGTTLMAIEVTERAVDETRVVSAFRTKIAPAGIEDYVFLVNLRSVPEAALLQAEQYFAQGHEVNFVDIRAWALNSLVTIGKAGRGHFNEHLQEALSKPGVPQQIRAAWNSAIGAITSR